MSTESRKCYPSDLTDEQWELIEDLIPESKASKKGGRPRWRRLSRDYEHRTESSEAMVKVASIGRMLRRMAPDHAQPAFSNMDLRHNYVFG